MACFVSAASDEKSGSGMKDQETLIAGGTHCVSTTEILCGIDCNLLSLVWGRFTRPRRRMERKEEKICA